MRVEALRRRLGRDLAAAVRSGDPGRVALAADRDKAIAIATMGREGDEEVDVDALVVGTGSVATILGFHPEHVRRLIRSGRLTARRAGGDYRLELRELWPFIEARHQAPGRRRRGEGR